MRSWKPLKVGKEGLLPFVVVGQRRGSLLPELAAQHRAVPQGSLPQAKLPKHCGYSRIRPGETAPWGSGLITCVHGYCERREGFLKDAVF